MMAAELYQKTLASYEASLSKEESMSLSRYRKIHYLNNRGLRYWVKKYSIDLPGNKPGRLPHRRGSILSVSLQLRLTRWYRY